MPRRPRLKVAGVPHHVIQRGNNRSPCFFADEDYRFYLLCLQKGAARYQCAIHAYALMTNHVHLLVSPSTEDGLSLMMRYVGSRYVQYVNYVYSRTGTRKIGYGRLDRLSDRTGLVIIAILPTYHGQGYGSRVLRTILFAAERHAIRLFADIRAENWRSIRLFAGHGFNPITSYHVLRGLMVRWEHLVRRPNNDPHGLRRWLWIHGAAPCRHRLPPRGACAGL